MISWEYSGIFQNSCFKEHILTAASEIIWGNRRDGFLLLFLVSTDTVTWKYYNSSSENIWENSKEKICVGVPFLNFSYQNTLW